MAIRFLKKDAADIATPAAGKVTLFVDDATGEPSYKDETGTTNTLVGAPGATGATGANGTNGTNGTNGQGVPTGGTAGQVLSKINSTDYNTQWVTPGTTIAVGTQTSSYTAALADQVVVMDNASANNFTVPPNSSVAFPIGSFLEVWQMGAGQTTIVAGSGVTILYHADITLKLKGTNSGCSLRKIATDTWRLVGDMELV